jgi:hypothetical protein
MPTNAIVGKVMVSFRLPSECDFNRMATAPIGGQQYNILHSQQLGRQPERKNHGLYLQSWETLSGIGRVVDGTAGPGGRAAA